jgi:hypothetical protein
MCFRTCGTNIGATGPGFVAAGGSLADPDPEAERAFFTGDGVKPTAASVLFFFPTVAAMLAFGAISQSANMYHTHHTSAPATFYIRTNQSEEANQLRDGTWSLRMIRKRVATDQNELGEMGWWG